MKTALNLFRLTLLSALVIARTHAQVEQVLVFKGTQFVQTSASPALIDPRAPGPGYGGPFNFRVSVAGTDIGGITAPVITLAAGSAYPTENATRHNGGTLTYDGEEWAYGLDAGNYGGPSEAGRDTSFAFGIYGLTVQGTPISLNFPANTAFPNNTPTVTLGGGNWVAGRYVIESTSALTITSNAFTNFSQNAEGVIDLELSEVIGETTFYSDNPAAPNFVSYTIPANTLTPGRDYYGRVSFYTLMDKQSVLSGALAAAAYERGTSFVISVITAPQAGARATFYGVGDLDGGIPFSTVWGATKAGGVIKAVGGSSGYDGSSNTDTAILWTSTDGLTALPNLATSFTAFTNVAASAITADGAYVGGRVRAGPGGNQRHAVRIATSGLIPVDLGTLPGFSGLSSAYGISDDGSVLYGPAQYEAGGKTKAVRYTVSGPTVTEIPFLNVGDNSSTPATRANSADGTVMLGTSTNTVTSGGSFFGPGNYAFRYVHGTGVSGVPFLAAGTWNVGLALDPGGNLALIVGNTTGYINGLPYIHNALAATTTALGTPSGYTNPSSVGGLNSDGSIVAMSFNAPSTQVFVRNGSGWHSLTSLLTAAGLAVPGWTFQAVTGLSPDGTLLYGRGMHNGATEGYLIEFAPGFLASFGAAPHDYSNDGKSDIVWQNLTTGDRTIWLMNGTAFQSGAYIGTVGTDWKIVGTTDFNGDGKADLLWENTVNGDHTMWLMNGTSFLAGGYLGTIPTEWKIAASADFNGDGKADLVWENSVTGDHSIWLMDGTAFLAGGSLGTIPTDWSVACTGDLNGDGKADLVWQNKVTGERTAWLMDGTAFLAGASLGTVPTDWKIAAVADFNGDGKADLVWENTVTGEHSIWLMNGTAFGSGAGIGSADPHLLVENTGDFNGDGKADLVWNNTVTGERSIWLMNGTAFLSGASLGTIGTDWQIAK